MILAPPIPDLPSPCNQVCTIDPVTQLCQGCARTLGEIAAWGSASPAEKHAILAQLERRQSVSSMST
ncbi:DUF1289 domain-containing protein [Novosphingobium sp. AAP83]|uniref:DUF1289 domain-containing protein n=1 Tax=Novosphingobium sp. AAP83 TaxID=1523425 RepID=UPI001E4DA650|nr:DUF1289 domain-containing protein [Novosphingobium sp. AAP83]